MDIEKKAAKNRDAALARSKRNSEPKHQSPSKKRRTALRAKTRGRVPKERTPNVWVLPRVKPSEMTKAQKRELSLAKLRAVADKKRDEKASTLATMNLDQLKAEAKRLDIKGRSKMNKDALIAAIAAAPAQEEVA